MFKKILSLVLAALLLVGTVATLASCGEDEKLGESEAILPINNLDTTGITPASDFKIGIICLHDKQSTYDANFINGMNRVKDALGLTDEQVIYKTGIDESAAVETAADELVAAGCKIIFADSFGHESFLLNSARKYPNVQFCHATGVMAHTAGLSNFHNAFASIYEGRYLAGIVAGMKLNELKAAGKLKGDVPTMGYVGAFTYAEVISGYTSFYLGAKSVCSDVQMKVSFTGSWYDETEEKNAADALIAAGCDLISQHADSMGAPTACEDAGIPNVSYNGSTYEAGETTFLVSSAINWSPYFLYIIKQYCAGEAIATDWIGTIATNSVVLSGLNQDVVAEGTKEALDTAIAGFKAGTLNVFDVSKFTVTVVSGESGKNQNATVDANGHLTAYNADTDGDYAGDTNVVSDGVFVESGSAYRSAPYFDVQIDGIELLNAKY